ncbi:hypothetical protein MSAN_02307900 [Mycena sanguinolenta]|uniref:Uncharacterized protein n=1 Tax=Mycena sanguinolenta TaxID=230812 RepID=A0A8H6X8E9_9AGAR|nr:hypothetical protein MSAN_02307900 [Mycena sanguinolenta]
MSNTTGLPNPFTPLAFLPPAVADQFEASRYLYAATLGAYIWDIALNLGNDYVLLFKHTIRFPTIVYFLSRWSPMFSKFQASPILNRPRAFTLAFILLSFVDQVASVENCDAIALGWSICSILAKSATTMLFFLRVTAVWHPSKIAYAVFFTLWLAVLAGGITAPVGVRAAHIGPTMQCITTDVPGYVEVAAIMPLVNETAIFLAINYRILAHMMVADSSIARLRAFFGGKGLSALSRALLQSGQYFYLVAVAANATLLVAVKLPRLPPIYRAMLIIPAQALANAMACLVFRRIKLGLISSDGTFNIPTIAPSSDSHVAANPRSLSPQFHHTDRTTRELKSNTICPLDVRVQMEIDKFEDTAEASQEECKPKHLASVLV